MSLSFYRRLHPGNPTILSLPPQKGQRFQPDSVDKGFKVLLFNPGCGKKTIRGMAMGPQPQECAGRRGIGVGIARWGR
jgi:hypothetical protein